jgi:uncharacterized protein (DUF58 family)
MAFALGCAWRLTKEGPPMRFWIREIAGWLLILLGIYAIFGALGEISARPAMKIFSAPLWLVAGFIIFRGGIHLLKVAVAARICLHAERQVARQAERHKRRVAGETPTEVMAAEW